MVFFLGIVLFAVLDPSPSSTTASGLGVMAVYAWRSWSSSSDLTVEVNDWMVDQSGTGRTYHLWLMTTWWRTSKFVLFASSWASSPLRLLPKDPDACRRVRR